ncbi:hypothetical protein N752_29665 [Desulforamulus aquiferis]|nr:S8 family peptidase [Desulforamulus aquiferis]RYD01472.1 hypothetical protein N752_29665 [Desulforamulus aquiferis]
MFDVVIPEIPSDDDFHALKNKKEQEERKEGNISGKVYCVMTDQLALKQLLSLWKEYMANKDMKFDRGLAGIRDVFDYLIDVRPWGIQDRLEETGVLQVWQEELEDPDIQTITFEIEFFFRKSPAKRTEIIKTVTRAVQELGGRIIGSDCCIEEIAYHAVMAELPRIQIQSIINHQDVALVRIENIMFFRPSGQIVFEQYDDRASFNEEVNILMGIYKEPIIALFDGLPQENHPLLQGLLLIDDPDDWSQYYQVDDRQHGTSMASLIAYGDLNNNKQPNNRLIYVRPIMKPYKGLNRSTELVPSDILFVDLIHRSVRRLFEKQEGAVAPSVRVINLSIGDPYRPYVNLISPLARLLDWLSMEYGVLFVISAGNHNLQGVHIGMSVDEYKKLDIKEQELHLLKIINDNARHQRILSPSESINNLTIGAMYSDGSKVSLLPRQLMPIQDKLPSPISPIGRGHANAIKPDLIYHGGRKRMVDSPLDSTFLRWVESPSNPPGCLAAAPFNPLSSDISVIYSHGTSDAAALISHEAAICYETLRDIFHEQSNSDIPYEYVALLIKAMLAHGASWDKVDIDVIKTALGVSGRGQDFLHKWIGYGIPDTSRVKECTNNRITLIGFGSLANGGAHIYELPLPFNFATKKVARTVIISLAYFTPTIPGRHKYRSAQLWFSLEEEAARLTPNRLEADWQAVTREHCNMKFLGGICIWLG